MSSMAYAPRAAAGRGSTRVLAETFAEHGSDVLLATAVVAFAAVLVAFLRTAFNVDSWLALVTGQEVWQHGIPFRETLTALPHGKPWVDQQWLSQLASYGLYRAGGLTLFGLANVALISFAIGGAVLAARRLGASARAAMVALPLCVWLVLPSREVRTQELVLPLFVAMAYLLAADSRSSSSRVYLSLPLLALWANLHGTVTLGVMLVVLRGVTLAWERRSLLLRSRRAWIRPLVLVLGASSCLLVTPYGLGAISYYHTMLLGSSLRHLVTEWQPITSVPLTAGGFFLAAGVTLWSFGRNPSRTTLWDRLALVALMAGSIGVIRNALFFGLAALVILPVSLNLGPGTGRALARTTRANVIAAAGAALALLATTASAITAPSSRIEFSFQRAALLRTVERATAADPSLKVFAEVRFADWLLWRDPQLRGRVASDARFELLTPKQMIQLQDAYGAVGPDWKQGVRGFSLIVADRKYDPDIIDGFAHEAGARFLYNDGERVVILRAAAAAR